MTKLVFCGIMLVYGLVCYCVGWWERGRKVTKQDVRNVLDESLDSPAFDQEL